MKEIAVGFFGGLSVGVYCLGSCLPVFLPILLAEKRSLKKSFGILWEFSLGRLLGYLIFGVIIGYLGQKINNTWIHAGALIITLWMGIIMILFSLNKIDRRYCLMSPWKRIKTAFLIGFLTGVNICPPFLGSLAYVFNLRDALKAAIYFLAFFVGTSVYLLPATFLGFTSKFKLMRQIAQFAGLGIGVYFVIKSLLSL